MGSHNSPAQTHEQKELLDAVLGGKAELEIIDELHAAEGSLWASQR